MSPLVGSMVTMSSCDVVSYPSVAINAIHLAFVQLSNLDCPANVNAETARNLVQRASHYLLDVSMVFLWRSAGRHAKVCNPVYNLIPLTSNHNTTGTTTLSFAPVSTASMKLAAKAQSAAFARDTDHKIKRPTRPDLR